jgi:hypothetical protein
MTKEDPHQLLHPMKAISNPKETGKCLDLANVKELVHGTEDEDIFFLQLNGLWDE